MTKLKKLKAGALTFAAILAALVLVSLLREWSDAPSKRSAVFALEQYVTHVQHPRTKLCFLVARVSGGLALTNVPCTPEVLREIERAR